MQHAGTITMAEPPNSAPTWILPIVTGAAVTVYTVSMFDYQLYRPLYWLVNGVAPKETLAMSLANDPTWSNGNKTVTFTLKSNYKWSDGQPITSKDVLFWWYEMKAAIKASPANWAYYTPGLGVPDQVASISAPDSSTVQMNLTKAVNPTWFWQDQIGAIQPMPSHAWAKSSASGPAANYNDPSSPKTISKWAMEDFGGFTNSTYPTTFGVFNSQGSNNLGGYTDPQADTLITASIDSPAASAVTAEASYLTTQQPGLFQPNPDSAFGTSAILVWTKTLSGTPESFEALTQASWNPEYMFFTK